MKDIIGNMVYFTPETQELLGTREPIPVDELKLEDHYKRVADRRSFVTQKLAELNGDYDQYTARVAELNQLERDEATLMNIDFDLASRQSEIAACHFDAMFDSD